MAQSAVDSPPTQRSPGNPPVSPMADSVPRPATPLQPAPSPMAESVHPPGRGPQTLPGIGPPLPQTLEGGAPVSGTADTARPGPPDTVPDFGGDTPSGPNATLAVGLGSLVNAMQFGP
jgi:hypothetical protein